MREEENHRQPPEGLLAGHLREVSAGRGESCSLFAESPNTHGRVQPRLRRDGHAKKIN